tara:strand:+ start:4023 stop:4700 length:678 start_codon:yes stop_codon:yes gene_type:complete
VQYYNNRNEESGASSLSNSRLQKAIERNRARMQKKEGLRSTGQQPLRGVPISKRSAAATTRAVSVSAPQRKVWSKSESDKSVESRLEKLRQKRASRVSRLTPETKTRKKTKISFKNFSFKGLIFGGHERPSYLKWITKISWLGLLCFFLHVCFGARGILEYYSRLKELDSVKREIVILNEENNSLVYEINQIENSVTFQRKVVRDYLGYISRDEYLVIFPESTLL